MTRKLFLIILLTSITTAYAQTTSQFARVKIMCNNMEQLAAKNIAVMHGQLSKDGVFTGEIPSSCLPALQQSGLNYQVIHHDISTFYQQRNQTSASSAGKYITYNCSNPPQYSVPSRFGTGSMGGYYTFAEAIAQLDSMRLYYPQLISAKNQIGTSIEGRPIYAVKISDNPDLAETEKQLLYTSIHHSQEPASLQQLICFMYYLLENYDNDTEIKYLVDHLEIFFVPVINPDGYVYNQTQNPGGGGTWRKNRRPNGLFNGVDLNRNYDYAFGYNEIGSSSIGTHPWYRGTSAFSEPESQAVKTFIESHNFLLDLNWHSYGNFLIYPWNYETMLTNDSVVYQEFSRFITLNSHYRYGTCDQTYGYNSNGDADDWGYGEILSKNKIMSFTAEIGSSDQGFWPQVSDIIPLCMQSLDLNLRFAKLATPYALTSDLSPRFLTALSGKIPVETYCLGLDVPADFTLTLSPLSSYITSCGPAVINNGMMTLEKRTDSITFNLLPGISNGTELTFLLSISNGNYTHTDTLRKIYCMPDTLLYDDASSLNNWTNNGFHTTTSLFHSAPSSFTESPSGNYGLLQSSSLELTYPVDLTTADEAILLFNARWEIEKSYDWVQIYASTDNGSNWIPLCGKYSSYGSDDQNESEPVYDGFFTEWVQEEISLNAFLGNLVKIKFTFNSDQTHNFDGFYLDNIAILSYKYTTALDEFNESSPVIVFPNPAQNTLHVSFPASTVFPVLLTLTDLSGKVIIKKQIFHQGDSRINIQSLLPGTYILGIYGNDSPAVFRKITVSP